MSDFKYARLKPAGWTQLCDPDLGTIETDTVQCVHCGAQRSYNPMIQQKVQWCMRCNGFICGPTCLDCVPYEKWVDCVERGVDPKTITTVLGGWSGKK